MSDPLKQRSALEKQLKAAWEQYASETQARQAAEIAVNRARRTLADEHKHRAAGTARDKDVTAAEHKLEQAEAAYRRHLGRANQALDAANSLELDLTNLLRRYPELFAEQAEAATQAAAEAMTTAAEALRASQEAWTHAQAMWGPLAKAEGIRGVEDWPLPDPEQLIADVRRGALVPRPQAVVVST